MPQSRSHKDEVRGGLDAIREGSRAVQAAKRLDATPTPTPEPTPTPTPTPVAAPPGLGMSGGDIDKLLDSVLNPPEKE